MLALSAFADNKAWNTDAQSGYFGAANWSFGEIGAAGGSESLGLYDGLYFSGSSRVELTNNLAGAEFAGITFNAGAPAYTIYGNSFMLAGPPWLVNNSANAQVINNDIVFWSAMTVVEGPGDTVLGGVLSGPGKGLEKRGAGKLTLGGANSFSGRVLVSQGTVALGPAGSLAKSTNVTLLTGAVLDVSAVTGGFHAVAGQTIGGRGTIQGPATVEAGARLVVTEGTGMPGGLRVNDGLVLEGATVMAIRKNFGWQADSIQVGGEGTATLRYGGTLVLTNLADIDIYDTPRTVQLFNAPNYTGSFSGLVLAGLSDSGIRVDVGQLREGGNGTIRFERGNRQPAASNLTLVVEKNGAVSFELAKYASDPDGDFLTPTFSQLEGGEKVTFTNGVVTYRPPPDFTGTRDFDYTVADSSGFASPDPAASITVSVVAASAGGNILTISRTTAELNTVWFAGIPGGRYQGQFSGDLSSWTDLGVAVTVGANGKGSFEHASPPAGQAFYRTRWVGMGMSAE